MESWVSDPRPISGTNAVREAFTNFFSDGNAEFEQGGSWFGWTAWDVANPTDSDVQFYFSVAP